MKNKILALTLLISIFISIISISVMADFDENYVIMEFEFINENPDFAKHLGELNFGPAGFINDPVQQANCNHNFIAGQDIKSYRRDLNDPVFCFQITLTIANGLRCTICNLFQHDGQEPVSNVIRVKHLLLDIDTFLFYCIECGRFFYLI